MIYILGNKFKVTILEILNFFYNIAKNNFEYFTVIFLISKQNIL